MIWFWIVAGLLTLAALLALLRPLVRQPRPGAEDEEPVAGAVSPAARGHRCRAGAGPADTRPGRGGAHRNHPADAGGGRARKGRGRGGARRSGAETSWRIGAAIGIAACCRPRRSPIYFAVGTPGAVDRSAATDALRRMARPSSPPRPTASRRICNRRPAISKGGSCSPAPWPRSAASPRRATAYAHAIALGAGRDPLARRARRGAGARRPGHGDPGGRGGVRQSPRRSALALLHGRGDAASTATPPERASNCRRCWPARRPMRHGARPSSTGSPSCRRATSAAGGEQAGRPGCRQAPGPSAQRCRRRPGDVAATAPGDDPRHGRSPRPAARAATPTTRPAGRGSPMPMTCWA